MHAASTSIQCCTRHPGRTWIIWPKLLLGDWESNQEKAPSEPSQTTTMIPTRPLPRVDFVPNSASGGPGRISNEHRRFRSPHQPKQMGLFFLRTSRTTRQCMKRGNEGGLQKAMHETQGPRLVYHELNGTWVGHGIRYLTRVG